MENLIQVSSVIRRYRTPTINTVMVITLLASIFFGIFAGFPILTETAFSNHSRIKNGIYSRGNSDHLSTDDWSRIPLTVYAARPAKFISVTASAQPTQHAGKRNDTDLQTRYMPAVQTMYCRFPAYPDVEDKKLYRLMKFSDCGPFHFRELRHVL